MLAERSGAWDRVPMFPPSGLDGRTREKQLLKEVGK